MPWFPMFVDLQSCPCLIVGGGAVAARKAEKLRPYTSDLRVVAPNFVPGFEGCTLIQRPYTPGDEEGMALVIAATCDRDLNHEISRCCRTKHIPVNVVDDREHCSFLFPALVNRGDLSIGISTGGASPTAARWLKEEIAAHIPPNFDAMLAQLEELRPRLKEALPEEADRSAHFAALLEACLDRGRPLNETELEELL